MSRPVATLSLDLDNKWAYLRAAGRDDWQSSRSFLPTAVGRMVDLLGELDLPLTVFIVGRDLADAEDCDAIRSFDRLKRWEPANHSFNHLPWMHTLSPREIADEIEMTGDRIVEAFGRRPFGFRGPGFSCPGEVLRVLVAGGYQYDASIFPTSIAPLARAFFMLKTGLKGQQRERAKKLYGGFGAFRQPNQPFRRSIDEGSLWEVPVTVMPFTRTPIHLSYLTYLASYSTFAAKQYFRSALSLCRLTGTSPSLLLHPPDFLGGDDDQELAYFPGMKMLAQDKLSIVRWAIESLADSFDVHCLIDQIRMVDPVLDSGFADRQADSSEALVSDGGQTRQPLTGHSVP